MNARRPLLFLGTLMTVASGCGSSPREPTVARPVGPTYRRQFARRVALVVGNSSYARAAALPNAVGDARAVAEGLERIGFHTTTALNHDLAQLRRAVEGFTRALERDDLVLVYYAGHGVSVGGQNYILPVDFEPSIGRSLADRVASRALSFDGLVSRLEARGTTNVLVFDACRDNPWVDDVRSRGLMDTQRGIGIGLSLMETSGESLVVFSTAPGRTADDGSGLHSPFTAAFVRHLGDPVPVGEMLRRVKIEVRQATSDRQQPWHQESLMHVVVLRGDPPPGAVTCPDDMVAVPGGSLDVASVEGDAGESSRRTVNVSGFCLDRTEVTVAAYRLCVARRLCPPAPTTVQWTGYDPNDVGFWNSQCNVSQEGRDAHPINCIDADQARIYCESREARLPTDLEWEYAASVAGGRRPRQYPWGDQAPDLSRLNACGGECVRWASGYGYAWDGAYAGGDSFPRTAPVGSFPAGQTPLGLMDMAGNVHEWTADAYYRDLAASGGSAADERSMSAGIRAFRTFRGGGWVDVNLAWADTSTRGAGLASGRYVDVGFRCARAAQ